MLENLMHHINSFESISLKEMDRVALMNRTDTKFLLNETTLNKVLQNVINQYDVLEVNGVRDSQYESHYLDTKDLKFYFDHHRGVIRRAKIRLRKYVESDLYFLEVKQKDKKGNTVKSRIKVAGFDNISDDVSKQFIQETLQMNQELFLSLKNSFKRITLVNKVAEERVTVDLALKVSNLKHHKEFEHLVIIEVKQSGLNRQSPIIKALRLAGFYPYRISKYCMGLAALDKNLKQNRFKQKLRKINKITN